MVKINELLALFTEEYSIDKDELFEIFATVCRDKYRVVNIVGISEYSIFGLRLKNGQLVPTTIKLTKLGAEDICKKVVGVINSKIKKERNLDGIKIRCLEIIETIQKEMEAVLKSSIKLTLITVRNINSAERHDGNFSNCNWVAVLKANKFMAESEVTYFIKRASILKPDIKFVLEKKKRRKNILQSKSKEIASA
ncbi:MAG: hypothetical protein PHE67_00530 [Campylobacterales bacterium]|nr:hypothetical protein [Campylobacterales bacterium]